MKNHILKIWMVVKTVQKEKHTRSFKNVKILKLLKLVLSIHLKIKKK